MREVREVVERVVKAFQERDADQFSRLHGGDAEIHDLTGTVTRWEAGGEPLLDLLLARFPDLRMTLRKESVHDSTVILEGQFTCRAAGDSLDDDWPLDADGMITGNYAEIFTVDGAMLTSHRVFLGEPYAGRPPWEIDGPQPAFVNLSRTTQIGPRVLDVGCGTGENALYLASRGLDVTGVDFSEVAIEKARIKAKNRGEEVHFVVGDVRHLPSLGTTFDNIIDSGLFHVMFGDGAQELISGAREVLRPGGYYHLLCLSEESNIFGARHLTQPEIRRVFSDGWRVESIVKSRFEVNGTGGWKSEDATAWLASATRL